MLAAATFVVLGLLPAYATGQLMIASAKCLLGYEWTFNTLNQSPCDVAASLAAVCSPTGQFDLSPLLSGYVYAGPPTEFANSCRCSSVYYSMLSACGYCQGRNFQIWSEYRTNCSTVSLQTYNQPLPSGVNVPAWAYLNVQTGDNFDITLAQRTRGIESSRLLATGTPSSTTSSITVTWSPPPATLTVVGGGGSQTNVGAIAGGVAGGVILIIISLVIIVWLRRRSRRSSSTTFANFQPPLQATRSNMTSPNSFPPTSGLDNFDGGLVEHLIWPQQSPFAPSSTTHSGRQTMHSQMMAQTQSDTPPIRYTMITPQNTNTIPTPQNTNTPPPTQNTDTMTPTQYVMHSTQNLWHQTRNTALPAQDMTPMHNTTQNVISALPTQNSTTNLPPRQNLTQSMISTSSRPNLTQSMISTSSRQNLTQSMISTSSRQNLMSIPSSTQDGMPTPAGQSSTQDGMFMPAGQSSTQDGMFMPAGQSSIQDGMSTPAGQSSTQNVVPMSPSQDTRQNTMPSTQNKPWSPPQYTFNP